jgi:hypothetical protein
MKHHLHLPVVAAVAALSLAGCEEKKNPADNPAMPESVTPENVPAGGGAAGSSGGGSSSSPPGGGHGIPNRQPAPGSGP